MVAPQPQAPSGLQWNLVPIKDLARGIDLRSAETNVADGYCEDLVNVDTVSSGQLKKRVGYEGYAGYVPFRVQQVVRDGFQLYLKLGTSVDLTGVASSPLVVYGKLPTAESADFTTTATARYYPGFSTDTRDVFSTSLSSTTKLATDTGVTSAAVFVDLFKSTSDADASSEWVEAGSVTVNSSTHDVTVSDVTNGTDPTYVVVTDMTAVAGEKYVLDCSSSALVPSAGVASTVISAATHGLGTFNIIGRAYELSGSTYTEVVPEISVNNDGDVTVSMTTLSNFTGLIILTAAPTANVQQIAAGVGETVTLTVTGTDTSFPYFAVYSYDGTTYTQVLPNSLTIDASAGSMTMSLTNDGGAATTFVWYYAFTSVLVNVVKVLDTTAGQYGTRSFTAATPELTVWGISQVGHVDGGAKVLHLDSYRREGEDRMVCSQGGVVYAARTRAEVGTTYDMPSLRASLNGRVATTVAMAPLFQATATSSSIRTRGIITGDNVSGGYAVVTGVAYVSANVADYTIALTNKAGTLTIGSQVATTDVLTVTGMAHAVHNGAFPILSVTSQSATDVVLRVANAALFFDAFDETGAAGSANVFTDQVVLSSASTKWLPGDVLSTTPALTVAAVTGSLTLTCSGVSSSVSLSAGLELFGTRRGYVHALKSTANVASVANLVRGDILDVGSLTRHPRVVTLQPYHDLTLSITVTGGTATASVGADIAITSFATDTWTSTAAHGLVNNDPVRLTSTSALPLGARADTVYFAKVLTTTTFKLVSKEDGTDILTPDDNGSGTFTVQRVHNLSVGQRVIVASTNDPTLDGTVTVTAVPAHNTFSWATASTTASAAGALVGRTVELDESLTLADALTTPDTVAVTGRWIPVETPATLATLPATTHTKYLNDTVSTVRSTMASSNLYLTNGVDPVTKFDGSSVYQAGLFRWQPTLFCQVDTSVGTLVLDDAVGTVSGVNGSRFTLTTGASKFDAVDKTAAASATLAALVAAGASDAAVTQAAAAVGTASSSSVGDRIVHSQDGAIYTVDTVDASSNVVYVHGTITGSASGTLQKVKTYRYYARLNAIDANNNVVASAAVGGLDMIVELSVAGQIRWRFTNFPAYSVYDYDRIELQLYRTLSDSVAPYYLIRSVQVNPGANTPYIDIYDATLDDVLVQRGSVGDDAVTIALKGAQLGTGWEQPPVAKHCCAVGNRMIYANLTDYQQLDIVIRSKIAALAASDLTGFTLLLRSDSANTGTTTDGATVARYEFVTSGAVTITPASDITATSVHFVVASVAHGLSPGDWVYLFHSAVGNTKSLQFAGWWQIDSKTTDTFTILFDNTYTPSSSDVDRYVTATAATDIPVWLGTDGNYSGLRGANTAGLSYEGIAAVRLADAVNSVTTRKLHLVSDPPGMCTAAAGGEYTPGQVVLRVPHYSPTFLQVTLGTIGANFDVYVNGVKRTSTAAVSATQLVHPARAVISYDGYPEIVDGPFAADSDSIIDVNPADGEEIKGCLPFFSLSAFGASALNSLVVFFKATQIYIYDLATRQLQKIDSMGQGCDAPASIAQTRNGIMFANRSGIYRLNRDLTVSYAGKNIERYWKETVNADQLAVATGTNHAASRQYKLSVPVGNASTASVVLVYDYTRETPAYANAEEGFGAWTRYTNHDVSGWANLAGEAYFATNDGQVFRLRNAGDLTDYRDDAAAVAEMEILVRSLDGGLSGARKSCRTVVLHVRMETSLAGVSVYAATENSTTFELVGTLVKTKDDKKVISFRNSLPTPRFTYLSLKITDSTRDQAFVLAGIDLLLAALGVHGLVERSKLS